MNWCNIVKKNGLETPPQWCETDKVMLETTTSGYCWWSYELLDHIALHIISYYFIYLFICLLFSFLLSCKVKKTKQNYSLLFVWGCICICLRTTVITWFWCFYTYKIYLKKQNKKNTITFAQVYTSKGEPSSQHNNRWSISEASFLTRCHSVLPVVITKVKSPTVPSWVVIQTPTRLPVTGNG